jgi:hypothetical protein
MIKDGQDPDRPRAHPPKKATTPVHEPLSLCESDPHSPKGSRLLSGTYNKGYPQSAIKKNKTATHEKKDEPK